MAAENIDAFLKERRNSKKTIDWSKVRLYGLPVLTTGIFVCIVLFLIIPKIGEIFGQIDSVNTLSTQQTNLQNLLAQTRALRSKINVLDNNLEIIETIAPSRETQVLLFRNKIQDLAESNGLVFSFQLSNDNNFEDQEVDSIQQLSLREVATQFEISGNFSNIIQFVNGLNEIEDFIVVREMSLGMTEDESSTEDSEWSLQLTLAKYQFDEESQEILQEYRKVDPAAELDSIMQVYLDNRN